MRSEKASERGPEATWARLSMARSREYRINAGCDNRDVSSGEAHEVEERQRKPTKGKPSLFTARTKAGETVALSQTLAVLVNDKVRSSRRRVKHAISRMG